LVVAFQGVAVDSVAPILSVPVVTSFTTKAVTVPSISASSPLAKRSAKVTGMEVSSLPVVMGPENCVSVGGSFTAPMEMRTVFAVADRRLPSKAFTVKASSVPFKVVGGVQTRLSPGAIKVVPAVTRLPFFVSVPPSSDSILKESGSLFGSDSSSAAASAAWVIVKSVSSAAPESTAGVVLAKLGAWFVTVTDMVCVAVAKPLVAWSTTLYVPAVPVWGYAKNHASGVDGHTRGKVRGRILDRGGAKSIADHVHLVLPLTHWHGKAVWHAKIIRCLDSDDFWVWIRIVGGESPTRTDRDFIIA